MFVKNIFGKKPNWFLTFRRTFYLQKFFEQKILNRDIEL